jgi:hypothetical protein
LTENPVAVSIVNDAASRIGRFFVMGPDARAARGPPGRRNIAQALADGGQPAMMVMAAPCAVAAFVTGLFVPDSLTAAHGLAPPP